MVAASTEPKKEATIEPAISTKPRKPTHEEEMEKITKMFSEMTAHIADLEGKLIRRNNPSWPAYVAEVRKKEDMNCYLCGRRGHFAKDC